MSTLNRMATYHILNGDALAEKLAQTAMNTNFIVCRECLIEGELAADNLQEFYDIRSRFIQENYNVPPEDYDSQCVNEFDKIGSLPDHAEVCLWFEDDLFCQANMWFCMSLLPANPSIKVYRVFPIIRKAEDHWQGFGRSGSEELTEAYEKRVHMTSEDLKLGNDLWASYQKDDLARLKEIGNPSSQSFNRLEEVVRSHLDRFPSKQSPGRPEKTTREILATNTSDFHEAFAEFSKREGIYGFGDLQFKRIYDRVLLDLSQNPSS